jgi:hypothetical protein
MAFSGGIYILTYNWTTEAAAPPIEIAKLDTEFAGVATGLSTCILRDGTGLPTAAIPFNSQRITTLGNATANADAANAGQVQNGSLITLSAVSGVDTITATMTPTLAAYTTRMVITFTPAGSNTGAATLNINGLGAKSIKKGNGTALAAADLVAAVPALLIYDGTNFVLINQQSGIDAATLFGAIADARLSANVPLLNVLNQTFTTTSNTSKGLIVANTNAGNAASVVYQLNSDTGVIELGVNSAAYSGSFFTGSPSGQISWLRNLSNIPLSIATNNTERIRIAGDGSVINLKATAVQVNGTAIPAYADATANFTGALQSNGTTVGYLEIPQNIQAANYTFVLGDSGKHIYHASGAGAGDTYTIPANSSVAYPLSTVLTVVNSDSNAVSIAITTDTMTLAGTTTTGTRSLAQNGIATMLKVTTTSWLISGTGLS